ncbi:MAG: extracellular solute-binding protein [Spirochaetaceae bacterium]|jgi:multiple sugar transport system substrate-binding protein|nr:extracellular solute-binding protein [Spirochaetaceae bacterium]
MKKVLCVLVVLVAFGASLFAGGTKAPSPTAAPTQGSASTSTTTIRWAYWGSENRVKISQQAIDIYQQQTGVTVNPEPAGGTGDHFTKVDTQIAGGQGPDIIQMGGNLPDYVKKGVLLDLNPYVGKQINTSTIDASAVESGTIDGKFYGVSTGVTMPALLINKTLIQEVGVPLPKVSMTYAEFRDYLVQLKAKLPRGVYPMQDIGALSSNSTPFGYWSRYNGTPLYDDVRNVTYVKAADAQKYLELWKDYRDNGLIPPAAEAAAYAETSADTSAIIARKVAITYVWTNGLAGYQQATKDDLDLIEFPGAEATKALWPAPSQFYTVNKDSKNIEEAVKFINFLVNSADAGRVLGNDRGASASSTARAGASSTATDSDKKILSYLSAAGPHSSKETAHVPNDTELNSTLFLIYQGVAFGQKTPAQGGQEIVDLLNRLIAK